MHLLLVFIIAATWSEVVSSESELQVLRKPNLTNFLVNLDDTSSRCGRNRIDIRELTILQFQEHFRSGRLTSAELTDCYLNRIAKIDVELKSVIETNPQAMELAHKADRERQTNSTQSLMHGIPILIKDNIGTADLMQTTAGSLALEDVRPLRDAEVIRRLREAGAIILGKTNPSEFALNWEAMSGWSSRGGLTRSPYEIDMCPSGSSTGSAVSIAVNLGAVALGTETDGSILSPSARNGLVGLKTTIGAVSTKGVIPLSFSSDVVGPMARSVSDAAIVLGAISDLDLQGCDVNITACLPNKNLTIGVLRFPFWNISAAEAVNSTPILDTCLKNLSRLVTVIDPVISPTPVPDIINGDVHVIFGHEFKYSLNNYLKDDVEHCEILKGRNISSLAEIIKFNRVHSSDVNQSLLEFSDQTDGIHNQTYLDMKRNNTGSSTAFLEAIFERYDVDALATPCHADRYKDLYTYGAHAGYPSIGVPVGTDDQHMPFGLCLLGKLNSEAVLLKLAHLVELARATERPVPQFAQAVPKADPQSDPQSASQSAPQSVPQSAPKSDPQSDPQSALQADH